MLLRRAAQPRARTPKRSRFEPDDDYLRELNEAYHHFFFHYTATPLLVVETSQFDSDAERRGARRSDQADPQRWARARGTTCRGRSSDAVRLVLTSSSALISCRSWPGSRRPASRSTAGREKPSRVPEGLWVKCPGCAQIIYNKDLATNLQRLPEVRASLPHQRRRAAARCSSTATVDRARRRTWRRPIPLQFTDTKPYRKRARRRASQATGLKDAVIVATGHDRRHRAVVVAAMEYGFIGGSMGVVVGEKITRAIERAIDGAHAGRHRLAARAARG